MKRMAVFAALAATLAAGAAEKNRFEALAYNRAGTSDLKGGLFSWPMMFDVNGDGRLDVILSTGGIARHAGHWYFENTGRTENGMPVFKAGVRIKKGGERDGKWLYRDRGNLSDEALAGHTTSPSPCP